MVFIESPIFTADVKELLNDEDYAAHCHFTAPFLLAMPVVTLLFGLDVDGFGRLGFDLLGNVLGVGALILCWGRSWCSAAYFPRRHHQHK